MKCNGNYTLFSGVSLWYEDLYLKNITPIISITIMKKGLKAFICV